jgi:hypothetical protein
VLAEPPASSSVDLTRLLFDHGDAVVTPDSGVMLGVREQPI